MLEVETKKANQLLADLHDALLSTNKARAGDLSRLITQESRLLLKQVIALAPPPGSGTAPQKVGENAVRRDLKKVFSGVDGEVLDGIGSESGVANIYRWITRDNGSKVRIDWRRILPRYAQLREAHRSHRDNRGRVHHLSKPRNSWDWFANYAVRKEDLALYLKEVLSHVGLRKSGWGGGFVRLGGKLPRWMKRHIDSAKAPGEFTDNTLRPNYPEFTARNFAKNIREDERLVRNAFKARARALSRRIKLVLSRYSKEVKAGMRPRRMRDDMREAA